MSSTMALETGQKQRKCESSAQNKKRELQKWSVRAIPSPLTRTQSASRDKLARLTFVEVLVVLGWVVSGGEMRSLARLNHDDLLVVPLVALHSNMLDFYLH